MSKKPCTPCDLIALDSRGHEVPPYHPSTTGWAHRVLPTHRGRCSAVYVPAREQRERPWEAPGSAQEPRSRKGRGR